MNLEEMNRLVIIGNGFDLAHKMKTSYKDFILDFLKESLQKLTEENPELRRIQVGRFVFYEEILMS